MPRRSTPSSPRPRPFSSSCSHSRSRRRECAKAGCADGVSLRTSQPLRSSSARSRRSSSTRRSSRPSESSSPAARGSGSDGAGRPGRSGSRPASASWRSGTTGRSRRPASGTWASSTRSSTTSCSTRPIRAATWTSSASTRTSPATSACTRTCRTRRCGIRTSRRASWTASATRSSWASISATPGGSSTGSDGPLRPRSGCARSISGTSRSRRACLREPAPRASRSGAISGRRARRTRVGWLLAFFGGNLLAVALAWRKASPRGRMFLFALLVALLTAGLEFGVCAFADALDDLGRHLFVFHALCDLVLIADAAWLAQALSERAQTSRMRARAA